MFSPLIDSHLHVWQLSRGDYCWLTPDLQPLYRDFLPQDIQPILSELDIDGAILVQAAPTVAETLFLLEQAEQHDSILGVVGWVDMETPQAAEQIHQLSKNPYLLGIRPMIQDIADVNWMLKSQLTPSLNTLTALGLTFDALVLPQHLTNLQELLLRHPHLKVVIDHGAKPFIKNNLLEPWACDIQSVAAFPNVYCKLSGLVTEAGSDWDWQQLLPYMDHLFQCFGHERIMWGSDFPVIKLASQYRDWYRFCCEYLDALGTEAKAAVLGRTAYEFYSLENVLVTAT